MIRILTVDDYEPWRSQIRLLLQAEPEWQVVDEALGGAEGVQKTAELKPDVIMLDISLPTLNGIEAARRIRQLSPNSKIVFLSVDNSLDVVEVAMGVGALGYVHKTDARKELLPAVRAVLRGEQFLSSGLKAAKWIDARSSSRTGAALGKK